MGQTKLNKNTQPPQSKWNPLTADPNQTEATTYTYETQGGAYDASQYNSRSMLGQGSVQDTKSTAGREDIMKGVRTTLIQRMIKINTESKTSHDDLAEAYQKTNDKYDDALKEVHSCAVAEQETKEALKETKGKLGTAEDDAKLKEQLYASENEYLARQKDFAQSEEDYEEYRKMRALWEHLQSTADVDTHLEQEVNALNGMHVSKLWHPVKNKQLHKQRDLAAKKKAERDALHQQVQDYLTKKSGMKDDTWYLSDEYANVLTGNMQTASDKLVESKLAYDDKKAENKEQDDLRKQYHRLSADVEVKEKATLLASQKAAELLSDPDLADRTNAYRKRVRDLSAEYDHEAMNYYALVRKKDADGHFTIAYPLPKEAQKSILEYRAALVGDGALEGLSLGPVRRGAIVVNSATVLQAVQASKDPKRQVSVKLNIAPVKTIDGILASYTEQAEGGGTASSFMELGPDFKPRGDVKRNQKSGGQGQTQNQQQTKPESEEERTAREDQQAAMLDINETYGSKKHLVTSGDMLNIHTMKTKSGQEVKGVFINGEFIPSDSEKYSSDDDATWFASRKLGKGGRYAKQERIYQAILRSQFFNHVFSENIEHYMGYADPVSEAQATEVTVKKPPSTGTTGGQSGQPQEVQNDKAAWAMCYDTINYAELGTEEIAAKVCWQLRHLDRVEFSEYVQYRTESSRSGGQAAEPMPKLDTSKDPEKFFPNNVMPRLTSSQKNKLVAQIVKGLLLSAAVPEDRKIAFTIAKLQADLPSTKKTDWPLLLAACEAQISSNAANRFDKATGDGPVEPTSVFSGLINVGEIGEVSDVVGGILKSVYDEGDPSAIAGKAGDLFGAANTILEIVQLIRQIKEDGWNWGLSDEHRRDQEMGVEIFWLDNVFDTLDPLMAIFASLRSLMGGVTTFFEKNTDENGKPLKNDKKNQQLDQVDLAGKIIDTILDVYTIAHASFNVHKARRLRNRAIEARHELEGLDDENMKASLQANPQLMMMLIGTQHNANKQVAENSLDIATSFVNVAQTWDPEPISQGVLQAVKAGIGTFGKMIINGVYNSREAKAVFKAAFNEQDATDFLTSSYKSPFESQLTKTTGITSRDRLSAAARVMTAIDTQVMIRKAPFGSNEFGLAAKAIQPVYNIQPDLTQTVPKGVVPEKDPRKGKFLDLTLNDFLKPLGEDENWRATLKRAIS